VNPETAQDYSMRLWLRLNKPASLGLTPQDVSNAIKEQNAQSPAGRIGAEPAAASTGHSFSHRPRTNSFADPSLFFL
jgi:multidrug efflux pump subunit AcrB